MYMHKFQVEKLFCPKTSTLQLLRNLMLHKGTDTYFNIIKSSFSKILCLRGACQELSVLRLHCQVRHPSTWTQHMSRSFHKSCYDQATNLSQSKKVDTNFLTSLAFTLSKREHHYQKVLFSFG